MKKILFLITLLFLVFSCGTNKTVQKKQEAVDGIDIPAGYQPLTPNFLNQMKKNSLIYKINFKTSSNFIVEDKIERGFIDKKREITVLNGDVYEKNITVQKDDKIIPGNEINNNFIMKYKNDYNGGSIVYFDSKYGTLVFVFHDGVYRLQKTINFSERLNTSNFKNITPVYKHFYKEEFKKIE
jgi:hypothetical protein